MEEVTRSPMILKETAQGIEARRLEDELYSRRRLFLTTSVSADSAGELLKQLMYLNQENRGEEITLYINSPGGDVGSGLAVYDYIRMMDAPVRTVCTGLAASMGAILFLAGDTREMLPHSRLMIHAPCFGGDIPAGEKPLQIQKRLDSILQTRRILGGIIAERTGKPLSQVYEKTGEDSYFSAEEAVEFGLATKIAVRAD